MNPLNRSLLSSSDEVTTMKILALKIVFVLVSTALDQFSGIQAAIMVIAMAGVVYYLYDGVPFYSKAVNCIHGGFWMAILNVTVILLATQVTLSKQVDPAAYIEFMTKVGKFSGIACTDVAPSWPRCGQPTCNSGGSPSALSDAQGRCIRLTADHGVLGWVHAGHAVHHLSCSRCRGRPDVVTPCAAGASFQDPANSLHYKETVCAGQHHG